MAAAAFFWNLLGIGGTIGVMMGMGGSFRNPNEKNEYTTVEMILGINSSDSAGATPAITLFNNHGESLARWDYKTGGNPADPWHRHLDAGETFAAEVKHGAGLQYAIRFWPPKHGQQAGYLLLSAPEDTFCSGQLDGVCISAVAVSDASSQTVIMGDIARKCGAAWYWGNQTVVAADGVDHMPTCFWIDYDGSAGKYSARSMSFHLQSFKTSPDRLKYWETYGYDTLCKSTPRFGWWTHLRPFSWIPFFDPPLEFETDNTTGGAFGLDKDPKRLMDKPGQYDRHVERYMPPGIDHPYDDMGEHGDWEMQDRCRDKDLHTRRKAKRHRLIVSHHPGHSGRHLCESLTSRGPDFVSLEEKIFCDMDTKTAFPLCNDPDGIRRDCFRLQTHTLVLADGEEVVQNLGSRSYTKRGAQPKFYHSTEYWG